jgi:vacuolar protein sorting-associated protein 13A/C
MKPIEGAESEGALGFFKGMGKGLVGYVNVI